MFATTLALFLFISTINFYCIGSAVKFGDTVGEKMSIIDTIYYTFSILTVLGFSSIVPNEDASKLLTVAEALGAVAWLGLMTSVFVKRYMR